MLSKEVPKDEEKNTWQQRLNKLQNMLKSNEKKKDDRQSSGFEQQQEYISFKMVGEEVYRQLLTVKRLDNETVFSYLYKVPLPPALRIPLYKKVLNIKHTAHELYAFCLSLMEESD